MDFWLCVMFLIWISSRNSICQDLDDDIDREDFSDLHLLPLVQLPSNTINKHSVAMKTAVSEAAGVKKMEHYYKLTGKSETSLSGVCHQKLTKGGWGYFPFPGSCNQYLHCDRQNRAFLETCAVGTFFNGQKCVRAEDVLCGWDPCRRLPNGRRYSDGQTCYGYYKCFSGHSVSSTCPNGFSFNALKQTCIPDSSCLQPTGILHPCFSGTTHPVPGQPHMFYLWDGRDAVTAMECPKGLWYNPHVCVCDWIIPGQSNQRGCHAMFHFGFNGNFLEEYNQAPLSPNTAVSIYQRSALFTKGGRIVIWMMNDIDMDSEWALCFEFMTKVRDDEVALLSNDWKHNLFTYKLTFIPTQGLVKGYFRMKNGAVVELVVMGVLPNKPHYVRVAKFGKLLKMRVDNMPAAIVKIGSGVASARSPMVVGAALNCGGFVGFFDELKFFRCLPKGFFSDYTRYISS